MVNVDMNHGCKEVTISSPLQVTNNCESKWDTNDAITRAFLFSD